MSVEPNLKLHLDRPKIRKIGRISVRGDFGRKMLKVFVPENRWLFGQRLIDLIHLFFKHVHGHIRSHDGIGMPLPAKLIHRIDIRHECFSCVAVSAGLESIAAKKFQRPGNRTPEISVWKTLHLALKPSPLGVENALSTPPRSGRTK